MCGRPDLDKDHNIRAINFFILGFAVTAVTLRIVTKVYGFTRWGADDYLIIAASVSHRAHRSRDLGVESIC
jgi:hypothetical protein